MCIRFVVCVVFFYIASISCDRSKNVDFDLIISNTKIVDVASGEIQEDQMIGILDGRIVLVDESVRALALSATRKIDVEGRFVMPGLWDNHVHFRGGDSLISENKELLPLFLKFGVTTVRDGGGDITPSVLQWKSDIEKGTLLGPTIFSPGPKLDGSRPAWEGSLSVTDEETARLALDSLQSLDASFVKVYDGNLGKEAFYSILDEAKKRGLKTTGHMPLSADVLESAERGLNGTEHLYYIMKSCSPLADSLSKLGPSYAMMYPIARTYDEALAEKVFAELAGKDFYVTPTSFIGKVLDEVLDVDHVKDSLLSYIGKGIQKTYEGRVRGAQRRRDAGMESRESLEITFRSMVKPMQKSGINILAGSDCGPFNSFVYPGESLWEELKMLAKTGLSPQEVMTSSVINGPKWFDLLDHYGSVESGKIADLIVLDKNPLEDISHIESLRMVIKHGILVHER